jgi:Domain of unknown function (DUF6046)
MSKYNVSRLFQAAFGINSPVYITEPLQKNAPANLSFKGIETLPDYYKPDAVSWMGTPIMFSAKFLGRSYKIYNPDGSKGDVQMPEFQLPAATMFSFRRAHNITRTNVLGNSGTVKEIYGFDDWVIDVRGLCLDEPTQSAHQQLEQLLQWEKIADGIGISGKLFIDRQITQVCIADWSDNLQQGSSGVIAFQFQLFSDEDIILALK